MKLYGTKSGPGPRRVMVYLEMKGLAYDFVETAPYTDSRSPEFLAKNPSGKIPVLETDDGQFIFESQVILQYLEEQFPEPPMHGKTEAERQRVDVQYALINEHFHYTYISMLHISPYGTKYLQQSHDVDMVSGPIWRARLEQISEVMGEDDFLAGTYPTIADVSLFVMLEYTRERFGLMIPPHLKSLKRWFDRFLSRSGIAPLHLPDAFFEQAIERFGAKY